MPRASPNNDALVATPGPQHSTDSSQPPCPDRAEAPQLVGAVLGGGKLRLDAKLGAGAMGEVYRATHRELQMTVAVKVLLAGANAGRVFSERFHAEALAASLLDHKNLTRVIDFGEEPNGLLYLSMEYLHGRSLEYELRGGALPQSRAVAVMIQICAGLWHAHARSVIHRDIKPANILLVPSLDDEGLTFDLVKVCDFGIATAPANTGNGEDICGTPEYMAPEVLMGEPIDGRADLYACGVLLFELVTGRLPFQRETVTELARAHILDAPPRPSSLIADLDPALEQIILRAMAKAPADRFISIRAMRNALKELHFAPDSHSAPALTSPFAKKTTQDAAPVESPGTGGREAWIEDAAASYDSSMMAAASGGYHEGELLATELVTEPKQRLDAIVALRSGPAFADAVDHLEMAILPLAKRGEAGALSGIVRAMAAIYAEATAKLGSAATAMGPGARALALLQTIASRETLRPLVERTLSDPTEPSEHVASILSWAQHAGASALYAVRLDASRTVNLTWSRGRFVALMRRVGAAAIPVLRDALDRMAPNGETLTSDAALVCDLLMAIPRLPDPKLAEVARRYARAEIPAVAAAALRALGALGEIDQALVRRLEALVTGQERAALEVRLAAADALATPMSEARGTATRVTLTAVLLGSGMLSRIRGDAPHDELIVACARTALTLSRRDAVDIVKSRAQKSSESLRARLLSLL